MAKIFNANNNQFNQGVYFNDPLITGPINITSTGVISEAFAAVGMLLEGGAYSVTVNGLLSSTAVGSYGLSLGLAAPATPNQISTVVVGATGEIYGNAYGIASFHAANITNNGLVSGINGIYVSGGGLAYTISNGGDIETDEGGYAIWVNDAGTHTINNSGGMWGNIAGSYTVASSEIIVNSGSLYGDIYALDGVDSVSNSGFIEGGIYLDGGDDTLVNTGTIWGDINGWTGIDTLQNDGALVGFILAGADNDIITNSGTIDGGVDGWTGNDTFTNTGIVNGWIFMGEGNDKFVGGVSRENLADEMGTDRYEFGDGVDNFDAVGAGSNSGYDYVHGGTQTGVNLAVGIYGDEYNAFDATSAVFVNINNLARVDSVSGISHAGYRAQGVDTGQDTVVGFETVYTGSGNDVVFGNGTANYILAVAGNDHLFGGAGNDYIDAGIGADFIAGETGRDTLDAGVDTDIDTFIYKALNESTTSLSGRDTLLNFAEIDRIDFSGMVLATGDVNHFVGVDINFDGLIGAVRVLTTSAGWTIQVDSNGDRAADMAISVADVDHTSVADWSDNFLF